MDAEKHIKQLKAEVAELRSLLVSVLEAHDEQLEGLFSAVDTLILAEASRSQETGNEAQAALLTRERLPRCTPASFSPAVPFKAYRDALRIEEETPSKAVQRIRRMQALMALRKLHADKEAKAKERLERELQAKADYETFTDRLAGVGGSK